MQDLFQFEHYLISGCSFNLRVQGVEEDSHVRIMQSKSCRYGDERTLIVRSYMGERTVYYIGARTSRARPNQALACATE